MVDEVENSRGSGSAVSGSDGLNGAGGVSAGSQGSEAVTGGVEASAVNAAASSPSVSPEAAVVASDTTASEAAAVKPVVKENFWLRNFDLSEPEKKPLLVVSTALNLLSLFCLIVWAFPPSVLLGFSGGVVAIVALSHHEKPRGLAVMNIVCGGLLSLLPLAIISLIVMVAGTVFASGMMN